ncbi:MAG: glycosyltransferase [Planctomycetales bacterium]
MDLRSGPLAGNTEKYASFQETREMLPKVSFLVPLYNEADTVLRMLQSVLGQNYPTGSLEIVIALAPSSDKTEQIVRDFMDQHPEIVMVLIDNPGGNTSTGRNLCLEKATGDYVLNFSGHAIADTSLVRVLVDKIDFLPPDVAGIGCGIQTADSGTWIGRSIASLTNSPLGGGGAVDSNYNADCDGPARSVAFTLYRTSILRQLGGFDPAFWCGQDAELNLRLAANDYRLWFTPDTRVQHIKRKRTEDFIQQMYRYGIARARLTWKHPHSFRMTFLLPSIFLLTIVLLAVGSWLTPIQWITLAGLFAGLSFLSAMVARSTLAAIAISPFFYFTMYVSYGFGFLRGWLP